MTTSRPSYASVSEAKFAAEKAFLLFTPAWCGVTGAVMVTGVAESWDDLHLMLFGVGIAVSTLLFALWYVNNAFPFSSDRCRRRAIDYVYVQYCGLFTLAFAMNLLQTPFFFDVLHLRYAFKASDAYRLDPWWTSRNRNPIFLYFVTVAYFATYMAGGCMLFRYMRSTRFLKNLHVCLVGAFVAILLAFLETITNANPFVRKLFCYEDLWLALTFGSVCYGISFMLALPSWLHYGGVPDDDSNKESRSVLAAHAVIVNLAVASLDALILWGVRLWIAPHFTTVQLDAGPFGKCLQ